MITLIDTNVLIRFLISDKNEKYKKLYSFFESLEHGDIRVELKLIVLFQVIFILMSFYRVPKSSIADGIKNLLKYRGITIKEKKIVLQTIELWHDQSAEIVDCYLIACLEKDAKHHLYSYNRGFDKYKINREEP